MMLDSSFFSPCKFWRDGGGKREREREREREMAGVLRWARSDHKQADFKAREGQGTTREMDEHTVVWMGIGRTVSRDAFTVVAMTAAAGGPRRRVVGVRPWWPSGLYASASARV